MNIIGAVDRPRRQGPPRLVTRIALVTTELTSPAIMVALQLGLVAWASSATAMGALGWGCLAIVFGSLLPMGFIVIGAKLGHWHDHHLPRRSQRLVPMATGVLFMVIGLVLLALSGAPRALVAVFAMLTILAATLTAITIAGWKISAHAALVASTTVLLTMAFGAMWALSSLVVVVTGWARVHLGAHTRAQVVVGCLLGGFETALLLWSLH